MIQCSNFEFDIFQQRATHAPAVGAVAMVNVIAATIKHEFKRFALDHGPFNQAAQLQKTACLIAIKYIKLG